MQPGMTPKAVTRMAWRNWRIPCDACAKCATCESYGFDGFPILIRNAVFPWIGFFSVDVTIRVTSRDEKNSGFWSAAAAYFSNSRKEVPITMRTIITVARLGDVRVHAFCDRSGEKHVTGLTIHGALAVPTRQFWNAMAIMSGQEPCEFGKEFETFQSAAGRMGEKPLYLTLTVDTDGNALLDDVALATDDSHVPAPIAESLSRMSLCGDRVISPNLAIQEFLKDAVRHSVSRGDVRDLPESDEHRIEQAELDLAPFELVAYDPLDSDEDLEEAGMTLEEDSPSEWPLFAAVDDLPTELWGWHGFHPLPAEVSLFARGPSGTIHPSVN